MDGYDVVPDGVRRVAGIVGNVAGDVGATGGSAVVSLSAGAAVIPDVAACVSSVGQSFCDSIEQRARGIEAFEGSLLAAPPAYEESDFRVASSYKLPSYSSATAPAQSTGMEFQ